MNIEDLQQLLGDGRSWRVEIDELSDATLRLFLQDPDSGECGLLTIEAEQLVLPDEQVLAYSYQDIRAEFRPPEHPYDIATRVGPDYDPTGVPFLNNEGQGGLF